MSLPSLQGRRPSAKGMAWSEALAGTMRWGDLAWAGAGVVFIILLALLPLSPRLGSLLLDSKEGHTPIVSIHTIIWVIFFIGLGRLLRRWQEARLEEAELQHDYLPAGDDLILTRPELGALYQKLMQTPRRRFLPRLLERTVAQYQANKSISHAHTLLDSCLDLFLHELDLRYHIIRYIVWLIPTMGFVGSVMGIGAALAVAGATKPDDPGLLARTTSEMSVAFNGTFLALVLSAVLVYIMHLAQSKEERALNASAQYCIDRLINRLEEGGGRS